LSLHCGENAAAAGGSKQSESLALRTIRNLLPSISLLLNSPSFYHIHGRTGLGHYSGMKRNQPGAQDSPGDKHSEQSAQGEGSLQCEDPGEDEVPAQDIENDEPVNASLLRFKPRDIKYEMPYTVFAYAAFNGQTYGLSENVNLQFETAIASPSTQVQIFARETSLKAELVLRGRIQRDLTPQHNPQGHLDYRFEISIPARGIDDWKAQEPGSFKLPTCLEYTGFDSTDELMRKCYVCFQAKHIRVMNARVPKLADKNAEAKLKTFFSSLAEYQTGGLPIKVDLVMEYNTFDETYTEDIMLRCFTNRVLEDDHQTNPSYVWSKDSPRQHQLLQNNIFPASQRPALSAKNLVLVSRTTYDEPFDLKLPAVYSLNDEHSYALALATQISMSKAWVTFHAVPGTCTKTNAHDNDLPKMYLCSVRWEDKDLKRPRPGDCFVFHIPFQIPDCPAPPPDKVKPPCQFTGDGDENHYIDEMAGGDWTQYRETDEEPEAHDRYIESQRSKWFAEVIEPSELSAPGEPMMKLLRPRDAAWNGTESGPHVGTIIPALEIRISSSSRFRKWLSSDAKRREISIAPVFSTQTYKDAIRTTNKFFDEYDAHQQQTSLRHHLVHYMTTGDTTIDYS
jgi:hypothetical protein